jgi:nitrate/nitrite transporter NarK
MSENNYLSPTADPMDKQPLLGVPVGQPITNQNDSRNNSLSGAPKNFRQTWWRWVMLFFGCCFLLGSYFCYDNPGPIEKTMEEDLDISTLEFNLLYSVYSYPNTVLPIFGGIFLDAIGLRLGIMLFTTILTLGQAIFTVGGYYKSLGIMIAGRVVFGLGGESMSVA